MQVLDITELVAKGLPQVRIAEMSPICLNYQLIFYKYFKLYSLSPKTVPKKSDSKHKLYHLTPIL